MQIRKLESQNRSLTLNQPKDQNIAIQAKMIEELLHRGGSSTPSFLQYEPKPLMQEAIQACGDINLDQPFC